MTTTDFHRKPVHPHMRGEYALGQYKHVDCVRFIPTCVENISARDTLDIPTLVHPHMRGEYTKFWSISPFSGLLSIFGG